MSGPHVVEVKEKDFRKEVLERSREHPVLVDFWAPWCGPCQVLGPLLERLAAEHAGAFILAKVNADECPNLAAAFGIRSIPTVHLFADGRPVDGFQGALPEAEIRDFLKPWLPAPTADPLADAEALLEKGDLAGARRRAERHLAGKPDDLKAHLLLAKVAFRQGDDAEVERHVQTLPAESDEAKAALALTEGLVLRKACGGKEAEWRAKVAARPEDLDARYALGCCCAAAGRYEEALEHLLQVVKADPRRAEGAARKAMVTVFGLLPAGSDLARDYRRRLLLYL